MSPYADRARRYERAWGLVCFAVVCLVAGWSAHAIWHNYQEPTHESR